MAAGQPGLPLQRRAGVKRPKMATGKRRTIKRQLLAQRPECHYCHRPLTFEKATLDHVLPRVKFPHLANDAGNVVLACYECNQRKGAKVPAPSLKPEAIKLLSQLKESLAKH